MAKAVAAMLTNCSEIIFIDPHFGPENPRHRRPFEQFFRVIMEKRSRKLPKRIEVYTSSKASPRIFSRYLSRKYASYYS